MSNTESDPVELVQQTPCVLPEGYSCVGYESLNTEQSEAFKQRMRTLLEPLYGSQDYALHKIEQGEDRHTDIVLDEHAQPAAVLVYKTGLANELHWNMSNGDTIRTNDVLEVKTLALLDPAKDGRKGIGSWLDNRAENVAQNLGARGISLTVGNDDASRLFRARGYRQYLILGKPDLAPAGRKTAEFLLYKTIKSGGIDTSGRWFL